MATCYEFIGRPAHVYSVSKVSLLESAIEHFVDCGAAVPSPVELPRLPIAQESLSRPGSLGDTEIRCAGFEPPCTTPTEELTPSIIANLIDTSIVDMVEDIYKDVCPVTPPLTPQEKRYQHFIPDHARGSQDETKRYCIIAHDETSTKEEPSDMIVPLKGLFIGQRDYTTRTGPDITFGSSLDGPDPQLLSPPRTVTPEPLETPTKFSTKKERLVPSPLRIQKSTHRSLKNEKTSSLKSEDENETTPKQSPRFRPPRLPLKVIPTSDLNANLANTSTPRASSSSTPTIVARSENVSSHCGTPNTPATRDYFCEPHSGPDGRIMPYISPADAARIVRANQGIAFLRETIFQCIADLQIYVENVKQIQRQQRPRPPRRTSSFWSFNNLFHGSEEEAIDPEPEYTLGPSGEITRKETKEQRIARLRAEGWNTIGIRSPRSTFKGACYYQEFCNMVLNEINVNHS